MSSCNPPKLPQINFSGLEHGTGEWSVVKSQVMEALEEFSCFEVVCDDKLTPELREAFFGKAIKEPFDLPFETKLRSNSSDNPFQGYIHNIPGMDYESLIIPNCDDPESANDFTKLMWGDEGNPSFRETISKFLMVMKEIEEMVMKMVFESYGVEKYLDSYLKANEPSLRLSHYGAPKSHQVIDIMVSHTDPTMTTIVCQHEQKGLEFQSKDGSWTTPSQNSFNFLLGDYILAWSNGRLQPSHHRVKMDGCEDRYSTVYASLPNNETQVQTPKELVDEKHPLLFNPFYHKDYFEFRITGPGKNIARPVEAFCGTEAVIDGELKA